MLVKFALTFPLLLLIVGGTLDYSAASSQRARLQAVVDKAALQAAQELGLSDATRENVAAAVEAIVLSSMKANETASSTPTVQVSIRKDPLEVQVDARQTTAPYFGGGIGMPPFELEVSAVARIIGRPNICLLALEESKSEALKIDSKSQMTGNNCAIFSNSVSTKSIAVHDGSTLAADTVCAAGGIDKGGTISPAPYTDCPQFSDPLASRPSLNQKTCTYTDVEIKNHRRSISPGVYCGGLKIDGAEVKAEPGLYIITGGKLELKGNSTLMGTDVSFYLDDDSALKVDKNTTINLEARKTGASAGLLFFASRTQPVNVEHIILSRYAQKLLGTLYFPNNTLVIGSEYEYGPGADVGGGAAYTAIIARKILVKNKSVVTLNTNYDQTDVPVPEGIRGAAQPVSLVK